MVLPRQNGWTRVEDCGNLLRCDARQAWGRNSLAGIGLVDTNSRR